MALFAEDGDAILEFIQKGGLIAGHSVGIALCMFCGFIMVGFPAIWATIGVSIMLLVAVSIYSYIILNVITTYILC